MKLDTGSKLGPYEIIALIGKGGMGEVYRAHDPQLDRDVAIKVLPQELSADERRLARFENEARLASSLNHPNIVTIHSMGWQNERCYIAMELIDGQTLEELMETGPVPVEQAINISAQVADGLAKAHEAGIIHRDLKPKNVMLTKDGHAKILDFGLSKLVRPTLDSQASTDSTMDPGQTLEGLTQPGTILGTADYMSPEQATGRFVDYRSDQFSMGSLMYAILTGNRPFHGESKIQTLNRIIEAEPRPVEDMNPRVPAAFRAVIKRCLMKDPKDRYPSTQELACDLQQLELGRKVLLGSWTRRQWIRASIAVMILLAIAWSVRAWNRRPYQPKTAAVVWYQKGMDAMHSMAFDSAQRAFLKAVEVDPNFALAHASLARAYDEMGYSEKAKEQMLRAVEAEQAINLSGKDTKRLRVLQSMVMHQYDDAVPLLRQLEREASRPEKPAAELEAGWLAEKQYDTDAAEAAYRRALAMNPAYAAAALRLGFIQQRLGDDDPAEESFTKAEDLYKASSDYEGITETLYQRANYLNRRNRPAEAMQDVDQAIAKARAIENRYQEIRLQLLKSTLVRKQGDRNRAAELAEQAIESALNEGMDNLAASGRIALGNAFFAKGEYDFAEKNYRSALDIARRGKLRHYEALASVQLGSLFEQKNDPEQARQFVKAAIPLYDEAGYLRESVQAVTLLGSILCKLGSYAEAIQTLQQALPQAIRLRDSVTEARIRERLVDLLQARGNWPEALKESEQSARLPLSLGDRVYQQLNCAGLYWRLGRWQDATQSLAEIEQLRQKEEDPLNLSLLSLRHAEMAYAEGRFEKAKAEARKAIAATPAKGDQTEAEARLIEALAVVRTGRRNEGIQSALGLVREFEQARLAGNAASARLAIAEALVGTGEIKIVRALMQDALTFFDQHGIWESDWRAHLIAARVSEKPAESSNHQKLARAALDQLRSLWPSGDVEAYLKRADIELLYGDTRF